MHLSYFFMIHIQWICIRRDGYHIFIINLKKREKSEKEHLIIKKEDLILERSRKKRILITKSFYLQSFGNCSIDPILSRKKMWAFENKKNR